MQHLKAHRLPTHHDARRHKIRKRGLVGAVNGWIKRQRRSGHVRQGAKPYSDEPGSASGPRGHTVIMRRCTSARHPSQCHGTLTHPSNAANVASTIETDICWFVLSMAI